MNKRLCVILGIMLMTVLVGCGGGGGGSTDAGPTPGVEESNANLANLVISAGSIVFNPDKTSYNVEVDNTISSFTITPTLANTEASIVINGTEVESGKPFGPVSLDVGSNTFEIRITAQNGTTKKTYIVEVTRKDAVQKSSNAGLSGLTLSAGTLAPAFNANTTGYTAEVPNTAASLKVTPTAAGVNASITVNDDPVASGSASAAVSLPAGVATLITIKVTAEDGTTIKTYTVNVTRLAAATKSKDATLSGLTLSQGALIPAFSPAKLSYTVQVPNDVDALTLTPTAAGVNAAIKVNGNAVASGSPANAVKLNVGLTIITILVTAENGTTKKT